MRRSSALHRVLLLAVDLALGACSTSGTEPLGSTENAHEDAGESRDGQEDALTDGGRGPTDAEVDGSVSDAGVVADGATMCHVGLDCDGIDGAPSVSFCTESSANSCIQGACVWDCAGARSCEQASSTCLACADRNGVEVRTSCAMMTCILPRDIEQGMIEQSTCGDVPDWPVPFDGSPLTIAISHGAVCEYDAFLSDSPTELGRFEELENGTMLGRFPALGGVCTGLQAPTDAIRIVWSCPRCQFVLSL